MVHDPLDVDVCIIGAGFAGLTAARHLSREGRSVVVLEARDRVGGRTWTEQRSCGVAVDRGGAWLSSQHTSALALTKELGVATYRTHVAGSHLLVGDGRVQRYKGLIPRISPLAVLQIARAQWRVNRLARRVPVESPWTAEEADAWDAESVGSWLSRTPIRSAIGRDLFEMAVGGLFAAPDLDDVSLLNLLFLVHAHEKIERLFSIEGGAQEHLVTGGLGALADRMAHELGEAVRTGAPVREIRQGADHVVVNADGQQVTARFVVVAVPPALAREIRCTPSLADARTDLYEHAVAGVESKTLVVYDRPFWRDAGLSGQSAGPSSAAEVTIDSSPADAARGVLASFTFGHVAEQLEATDGAARKDAVLKVLVNRFGPLAASPVDFVETAWWHEAWSRGCSMAHFPVGVLSRHGHLLREPEGRLHWAGTETATVAHGAVEGAIRSGARAADEVLERLTTP